MARFWNLSPEHFIVGNGSDDIACELGIEPLCERRERPPVRLLTAVLALLALAAVTHALIGSLVSPAHALVGSAATVGVWAATVAIVSRLDLAFLRLLG